MNDLIHEKELLKKARSGDFEAFSLLVDAHKNKVWGLLLRLTGNVEDAEDALQETLFKAVDKIDQFRGESSFGTWLYSIALNQARAHFARRKQAELRPIEDYLPAASHSGGDDAAAGKLFDWKDPHSILESEEIKETIDRAIGGLPFKYREAFLLRYVEDLPVKEVARLTGQSEAAAKSRILRARLALRDHLSGIFEEEYEKKMPGLHQRS